MLCLVLLLVVLQLWLLTATMNAYLGGDDSVVWPAALASLGCLGLNLGLLAISTRLDAIEAACGRRHRAASTPAYFALVMATGIVSIAAELRA